MSYGIAPAVRPISNTCSVGANKNWASGSTKRRISQGHAMRSIVGRSRVIHECGSSKSLLRRGRPCSAHPAMPPSRYRASWPAARSATRYSPDSLRGREHSRRRPADPGARRAATSPASRDRAAAPRRPASHPLRRPQRGEHRILSARRPCRCGPEGLSRLSKKVLVRPSDALLASRVVQSLGGSPTGESARPRVPGM